MRLFNYSINQTAYRALLAGLLTVVLILSVSLAWSYPFDEFERTQIRRLDFVQQVETEQIRGRRLVAGAKLPNSAIRLSSTPIAMPKADAEFSQAVQDIVLQEGKSYFVSVLDITDSQAPSLAEYRAYEAANVGSVGKIVVLMTLLKTLADVHPDDINQRETLLRDTLITIDSWGLDSSHKVVLYDPPTRRLQYRKFKIGDSGNLWEMCDWMMSASNNGSANMIIKQTLLLHQFGTDYPPTPEQAKQYFASQTPKRLGEQWLTLVSKTLTSLNLDPNVIMQGNGFSSTARANIAGRTSQATPNSLLRLMLAVETGQAIDEWSSLEVKRLMYTTEKRTRYASNPNLNPAAVYFKSGSLYSCGGGTGCPKYKGTKVNRLASVILVEMPATPAQSQPARYIVTLMSNELGVNSAVSHQNIAGRIHRLIQQRHNLTVAPANTQAMPVD